MKTCPICDEEFEPIYGPFQMVCDYLCGSIHDHQGEDMAKKKPNKAEREHMGKVADLGCLICAMPASVHHITTGVGMGQRASHYDTIPLCPTHHQHGGYGVAIHAGKKEWESLYGTELELLDQVKRSL